MTDKKYAVLIETNFAEDESWYFFIRKQGNEKALKHLEEQLNKINWRRTDFLSIFSIDTINCVSENTVDEMVKLENNKWTYHHKYEGKLRNIDFDIKHGDSDRKKIEAVYDLIGYGRIYKYVDDIPESLSNKILQDQISSCDSDEDDFLFSNKVLRIGSPDSGVEIKINDDKSC